MRRLLLLTLFAWSCTATAPEGTAKEENAPPIVELVGELREAGIAVEGEKLKSLREFPGCPDALLRYRLRFGGDFVNVSRFETPDQAKACLADFRSTVVKAGASAWDRMARDISVHGNWLFFFPPEGSGNPIRQQVLNVLVQAE